MFLESLDLVLKHFQLSGLLAWHIIVKFATHAMFFSIHGTKHNLQTAFKCVERAQLACCKDILKLLLEVFAMPLACRLWSNKHGMHYCAYMFE